MSLGDAVAQWAGEQLIKWAVVIFFVGALVAAIIIGAFWMVFK